MITNALQRERVKTLARVGYLIEAAAELAQEGRRVVIQVDTPGDRRKVRCLVKALVPTLTASRIRASSVRGRALMAAQVAEARAIQGRGRGRPPGSRGLCRPRGLGTRARRREVERPDARANLLGLLTKTPRLVDDYDLALTEDLWWRKEIEFTDPRAGPIKMILTPKGHRAVCGTKVPSPPDVPQTC